MLPAEAGVPAKRIPGEAGLWVLIGGELFAFSAFFLVFAYYRGQSPAVFQSGHETLDHSIGLINTLILLTSSLFVALGAVRIREERDGAAFWLTCALACGLLFAAIKIFEYSQKIAVGITPMSSDFFMYYFAFTGVHLLHVVIGSVGLSYAIRLAARTPSATRTMIIECVAIFWHLVDLLWIILFALFYLAGGNE